MRDYWAGRPSTLCWRDHSAGRSARREWLFVAARLGYSEMALRYFQQTAAIDLADTDVAIDGGVHIAALAGVWVTAVFGFAGLSWGSDGVAIDPQLPTGWSSLSFGLQWRGRRLKIRIARQDQSAGPKKALASARSASAF